MTEFESRYLTPAQVAADLQLDLSAVYKKCRAGEIPSVKLGKSVRIPRLVYQRYLDRLEGKGPEPLSPSAIEVSYEELLEEFRAAAKREPEKWIEGWRRGVIPDTPENSRLAIHALALRDAAEGAEQTQEATAASS